MKLVGLIGYPLGHSVSPPMQQAAFDHLGIDARYMVWETSLDNLGPAVANLRKEGYLGANVTIPHKQAVIPCMDSLSAEADAIGAVNTIVNNNGRLSGHNTDAPGFLRSLKDEAGFDPAGKSVVMLGAGGAARGVGYALLSAGARSLTIANRSLDRAQELAAGLSMHAGAARISAVPLEQVADSADMESCDLLVNATSVGLKGETPAIRVEAIPMGCLVYDLIYHRTPLMDAAEKRGLRVMDGLSMLVHQGALSFHLWTGHEAPIDVMMKAAREALRRT